MTRRLPALIVIGLVALSPMLTSAQINFTKSSYYLGMGDSFAAGTGANPATNGYVYDLYERGAFGFRKSMKFGNIAISGARSWELRDHQVPQAICTEPAVRPTIVTITAGANDFLQGDTNIPAIAMRVADAVNILLNNGTGLVSVPVIDPVRGVPCRPLGSVTILVSNYYHIPHPIPAVAAQLDAALLGFDQALRAWLAAVQVPAGSRVAYVDLYTPSLNRQGLVLIERRLGFSGPFDFEVHPTNLGHAFIAEEFERVWDSLQ